MLHGVSLLRSSDIKDLICKDDIEARTQFNTDFEHELNELCSHFSESFELLDNSDCAKDKSKRAGLVSGYLYVAIESSITATQLLSIGHTAASGNSMRIAYEALCYAALLKKEVKIKNTNTKKEFNFFEEYEKKSKLTMSHMVLPLVIKNHLHMGINTNYVEFLKKAKDFYNCFSHATLMLVRSKIKPSTKQIYVAGGYDLEQKEEYKSQIDYIIHFSKSMNGWVQSVAYNATYQVAQTDVK
jgi:hypothetical protein